ncbi:MAG: MFS transporter [Gaiellaceae bacterium]
MALPETFGVLREPRFRLLWVGQATSTLGDGLLPVALAFAVLDGLDRSATALGVVFAAHTLPLAVFVLAGGVWADRLPRQLVMLASDLVRCAVQATLAVLFLSGAAELWHLVTLIAVYGTAEAFFQPAATGLVPETVSSSRLQQANAMLGLTRSGAFVIGPAVAGALLAVANPGFVFAVDAATFAVSAVSLALLRVPRRVRDRARESFLAELAAGWRELVSRTWLWVIILWATTILFAVVAPFQTLGPLVAKQSLGGAAAWGMIAAAFGLGMVVGGLTALRFKPSRPMLACSLAFFLAVPGPALLAMRAPAIAIAGAQVLAGVAIGFFIAVWQTTMQQHVPEESLSRVSAWDWLGSFALVPLGFVLAGPVSDQIGVSTTLWISAGWCALSTALVLAVPGIRNLRRLEEETGVPVVPAADPAVVVGRPEPQ